VNRDVVDALRLVLTEEAIALDPVYTGKAMVGMRDLIGRGVLRPEHRVVFLHTGGTPALFPNRKPILELLA
jgi:D-cysteine desulfhydrase